MNIIDRLATLTTLQATYISPEGTTHGTADVTPLRYRDDGISLVEDGHRHDVTDKRIAFSNHYIWQQCSLSQIALSHMRWSQPVHLITFQIGQNNHWHSISPHYCGEDVYHASLNIHQRGFILEWNISGPHKQQTILLQYH